MHKLQTYSCKNSDITEDVSVKMQYKIRKKGHIFRSGVSIFDRVYQGKRVFADTHTYTGWDG